MTPCPLMHTPIMNIAGLDVEEIARSYAVSPVVHGLLDQNFSGKCGNCERKESCGGCRARALGVYGDYLAEDPACWL